MNGKQRVVVDLLKEAERFLLTLYHAVTQIVLMDRGKVFLGKPFLIGIYIEEVHDIHMIYTACIAIGNEVEEKTLLFILLLCFINSDIGMGIENEFTIALPGFCTLYLQSRD